MHRAHYACQWHCHGHYRHQAQLRSNYNRYTQSSLCTAQGVDIYRCNQNPPNKHVADGPWCGDSNVCSAFLRVHAVCLVIGCRAGLVALPTSLVISSRYIGLLQNSNWKSRCSSQDSELSCTACSWTAIACGLSWTDEAREGY
jgi:hypothetical protein